MLIILNKGDYGMRINKWLVLVCALSMLFMFSMSCVMLVQSAGISSSVVPNVITKTTQFGVPAAFLECDAHQLIKAGGIYSFTGKSPISFTGLSVGWSVNDPTADPRSCLLYTSDAADE